jgi:hypothetical protein
MRVALVERHDSANSRERSCAVMNRDLDCMQKKNKGCITSNKPFYLVVVLNVLCNEESENKIEVSIENLFCIMHTTCW